MPAQRAAMSNLAHRPIDQLARHWAADSRSAASALALERLAGSEPAVAALGAHDLGDVVSFLGDRSDRPAHGAGPALPSPAAVIQAMLRSQQVHPLVPRAILQAVLPGLVGVARRLGWGAGGEWPDGGAFFVDVLTTAWETIVEWSGQDRPYAVLDLLSAVRCRMRRQLLRHRSVIDHHVTLGPAAAARTCSGGSSDLDELARAIDEAVAEGLDAADASVLYAHRVLGYTLTELSELTGRSRRYLGERRDRATEALIA